MNLSLRAKIITSVCILIFLIAATLTFISYTKVRTEMLQSLTHANRNFAHANTEVIRGWLESKVDSVNGMAEIFSQTRDDQSYFDSLNQGQTSGGFIDTAFGNTDGSIYMGPTRVINPPSVIDARVRPWFKQGMNSTQVGITDPFISKVSGELIISFYRRVDRQGVAVGVMNSVVGLNDINQLIEKMNIPGDGFGFLMSKDGVIISHPSEKFRNQPLSSLNSTLSAADVMTLARNNELGQFDFDNTAYLVNVSPVELTQWYFVMAGKENVLMASLRQLTLFQIVAALVLTAIAIAILFPLIRQLLSNLVRVSDALAEIAKGGGDLTRRIDASSQDEVGMLATNFNAFVGQLQDLLKQVSDTTQKLLMFAAQSSDSANRSAQKSQSQESDVTMVATAVTEMTAATQEIASNAEMADTAAKNTVGITSSGREFSQQVRESINKLAKEVASTTKVIAQLDEQSQQINSIVGTISSIAEQTNLLALNAAIEAARAGEQGRGFAVVADEVRELSQRTHKSTQEINDMLATFQTSTGTAVGAMENCQKLAGNSVQEAESLAGAFADIAQAIDEISQMASYIATAAEEQTTATSDMNQNTESIHMVATDMLSDAKANARLSDELQNLALSLEDLVKQFKLD